jgi:hypothetical protein
MKNVVIVLFMLVDCAYNPAALLPAQAVKESGRFGIPLDEASFPQNSPENLRKSLLNALNSDKIEYMLAHLADPSFIDKNVREVHEGDFAKQVAETREKLKKGLKSPLESLLKEGKLNSSEKSASLKDPALKDFIISMKLENNKWYMENNKK